MILVLSSVLLVYPIILYDANIIYIYQHMWISTCTCMFLEAFVTNFLGWLKLTLQEMSRAETPAALLLQTFDKNSYHV